jgi:hypothetical protein
MVEREKYANIMYCVSSLVHIGLVVLFAFTIECNFVMLGLLMLAVEALFLFVNILIPYLLWRYSPFEKGLFESFVLVQDPTFTGSRFLAVNQFHALREVALFRAVNRRETARCSGGSGGAVCCVCL